MSRKTIIICIIVGFATMMACIYLGVRYHKEFVSVIGVAGFCIELMAIGIIQKVLILREIADEIDVKEKVSKAKNKFSSLPRKGKLKILGIFVPIVLFFLLMIVGIALANAGTLSDGTITKIAKIGFILMGIGGGGFVLEIALLVIITKINRR